MLAVIVQEAAPDLVRGTVAGWIGEAFLPVEWGNSLQFKDHGRGSWTRPALPALCGGGLLERDKKGPALKWQVCR